MSQRLQVIRRDVIPWILPPRPDRHPAPASAGLAGPALAGEAGSATSPTFLSFCASGGVPVSEHHPTSFLEYDLWLEVL